MELKQRGMGVGAHSWGPDRLNPGLPLSPALPQCYGKGPTGTSAITARGNVMKAGAMQPEGRENQHWAGCLPLVSGAPWVGPPATMTSQASMTCPVLCPGSLRRSPWLPELAGSPSLLAPVLSLSWLFFLLCLPSPLHTAVLRDPLSQRLPLKPCPTV